MPGVLAAIFITPVEVLTKTRPDDAENVPALAPGANIGEGLPASLQY